MNDKPSIVAQQAQQAAAVAADAAAKTEAAVDALPPSATRNTVLKVLATVGLAAGIVTAAATGGVVAAVGVGVPGLVGLIAAWLHPSPQAVTAFGSAAK